MSNQTIIDSKITTPDSLSPTFDGDFRLLELSLHSPNNVDVVQLNSSSVFVQMEIFEDLFSNVLRGTLTILDSQGLAELIPFIGDETLIMTFFTPGGQGTAQQTTGITSQTKVEEASRQRFKIYDCVEIGTQERTKIYKLYFVSEEYVFNMKKKVSKGYKGLEYSIIIKDLMKKLNNDIESSKEKKIFVENTLSEQNVIIPNWTPFQAINFCASRALSSDIEPQDQTNSAAPPLPRAVGSIFVFYEKLGAGFFFESLESMILKQKMAGKIPLYQYSPKLAESKSTNTGVGYFSVDKFEIDSSFKTLENLGYGMFGSKLIAYDPIRMKYDVIKYDYYEQTSNETISKNEGSGADVIKASSEDLTDANRIFADFIATDISPDDKKQNKIISSKSDYLGSNETSIKLSTTTKDHSAMFVPPGNLPPPQTNKTFIGVSPTTFKDNEAKQNNVENWLLQREMQVQEFDSVVVKFTVPGNTSRHVGDLIRFEMPTSIPDDSPEMQSIEIGHRLYSGNYLVSKIRHVITVDKYDMDMEIIKNSFAKRIGGQLSEMSQT
ncbi:MAG: hypothetical protein QGH83_04345 [Candidatus Pacebacteria bacterium]|nr:hypothetical protein [Candidatus Paceibacterota bacterium]